MRITFALTALALLAITAYDLSALETRRTASPGIPAAGPVAVDTADVVLTLAPRLTHPMARATIVRPVGAFAPDVIVVTAETTPSDLHRAMRMLASARHTFGRVIQKEMLAHVPPAEFPLSEAMLRDASRYLEELKGAPEVDVPGIGRQPTLMIAIQARH
jgi:hypothetical protein